VAASTAVAVVGTAAEPADGPIRHGGECGMKCHGPAAPVGVVLTGLAVRPAHGHDQCHGPVQDAAVDLQLPPVQELVDQRGQN
jgi:hypothetical protein